MAPTLRAGRFFLVSEQEVTNDVSHLFMTRIVGMETVGNVFHTVDLNVGLNKSVFIKIDKGYGIVFRNLTDYIYVSFQVTVVVALMIVVTVRFLLTKSVKRSAKAITASGYSLIR